MATTFPIEDDKKKKDDVLTDGVNTNLTNEEDPQKKALEENGSTDDAVEQTGVTTTPTIDNTAQQTETQPVESTPVAPTADGTTPHKPQGVHDAEADLKTLEQYQQDAKKVYEENERINKENESIAKENEARRQRYNAQVAEYEKANAKQMDEMQKLGWTPGHGWHKQMFQEVGDKIEVTDVYDPSPNQDGKQYYTADGTPIDNDKLGRWTLEKTVDTLIEGRYDDILDTNFTMGEEAAKALLYNRFKNLRFVGKEKNPKTGKMENVEYPVETAVKYAWDRIQKDDAFRERNISNAFNLYDKELATLRDASKEYIMVDGQEYPTHYGSVNEDIAKLLHDAKVDSENADKEASTGKDVVAGTKSFGRGFASGVSNVDNWTMGLTQLYRTMHVGEAFEAYDKGKATKQQMLLLNAFTLRTTAAGKLAKKAGWMYNAGKSTGESVPYGVEFFLSPELRASSGMSESALNGITKYIMRKFGRRGAALITRMDTKAMTSFGGRLLNRTLNMGIGGTYFALTRGAGRIAGSTFEKMNGQVTGDGTAHGEVAYTGNRDNIQSAPEAFKSSLREEITNDWSEMSGGIIGEFTGAVAHIIGKGINKVTGGVASELWDKAKGMWGARQFNELMDHITSSDTYKKSIALRKRMQLGSDREEWGEESFGQGLDWAMGGDSNWTTNPDDTDLAGKLKVAPGSVDATIGLEDDASNWKDVMNKIDKGNYSASLKEELRNYVNDKVAYQNSILNLRNQAETYLAVAPTSRLFQIIGAGGYGWHSAQRHYAQRMVASADLAGATAYTPNKIGEVNGWTLIKPTLDEIAINHDANAMVKLQQDLLTNGATTEQRKAVSEYLDAKVKEDAEQRYFDALADDPDTDQTEVVLGDAYDNGYSLTTQTEVNDAKNNLEATAVQVNQAFGVSEEEDTNAIIGLDAKASNATEVMHKIANGNYTQQQKDAVNDFINARVTYQGVIDKANTDIEEKIKANDERIDRESNGDGTIQQAVTKDNANVTIVKGKVTTEDNGDVISSQSDNFIVVKDNYTGKLRTIDSKDLLTAQAPVSVEQMKQTQAQQIRQTETARLAAKINGQLAFATGDLYEMADEDGNKTQVQVLADNGDGTILANVNGVQQTLDKATVQQSSQNYAYQRLSDYRNTLAEQRANRANITAQAEAQQKNNGNPVDENGNPDYEKMSAQDTYDSLVDEIGVPSAHQIIRYQQRQAQQMLDEANAMPTDAGSVTEMKDAIKAKQQAVKEAQQKLDYWNSVMDVPTERYKVQQRQAEARKAVEERRAEKAKQRAENKAKYEERKAEKKAKQAGISVEEYKAQQEQNAPVEEPAVTDNATTETYQRAKNPGAENVSGYDIEKSMPIVWKVADAIGKALGKKIQFRQYDPNYNGYNAGDTIVVFLNASEITPEKTSQMIEDVLTAVMGHETSHTLFKTAGFRERFVPLVKQYLGSRFDTMFNEHRASYDAAYERGDLKKSLTDEEIEEEISCDMAGQLLQDKDFINELLYITNGKNHVDLTEASNVPQWAESIYNLINKVWNAIKDILPSSNAETLSKMREVWLDAFQQTEAKAQEGIVVDGDTSGETKASIRTKEAPKNVGTAYAVYVVKQHKKANSTLHPKMIKGESIGEIPLVWLDTETGKLKRDENGNPIQNNRGRAVVSVNGKQTGGKEQNALSWRPGKHMAAFPNAAQFAKKTGKIPSNVIFFEVEYDKDIDYQLEAWKYGMRPNGTYLNDWGGLPYIPEDGFYFYRTNTISEGASPMIITGSYRIKRALTDAEAKELNEKAGGKWFDREGGELTEEGLEQLGISEKQLEKMRDEFPIDKMPERHDESADAMTLPGYVQYPINFEDPHLLATIKENNSLSLGENGGKTLEEYKKMSAEAGDFASDSKTNIDHMVKKEGLDEDLATEMDDAGLTIDGGLPMSKEASTLKQQTGYKSLIEIDPSTKFSYKTKGEWASSLLGRDASERQKQIVAVVDAWYERAAMDDLTHDYMNYADYPKKGLNKDGKGPLRGNVEYRYTFDLDTTCPRTFQYLAYADIIEKKIGRPLSLHEAQQLIEEMRACGQQIPCVYCYAENKRQALKQYLLNFMTARNGVLNAKDKKEAFKAMYGHTTKGGKDILTDAAQKVYKKWTGEDELNKYKPTIKLLNNHYKQARNIILTDLDALASAGKITAKTSEPAINKMVLQSLGIPTDRKQATEIQKNIMSSVSNIVAEWRYDFIEGKAHQDHTEMSGMADFNMMAMALWDQAQKYAKSASSAKTSVRYFPYTDQLQEISQEDKDFINGMGGLRMHSTNDFRIDYVGDYFQLIADMAQGGWKGHTYTKSPDFVRIFGNTGYRINMSIAAYDVDGKVVMNREEGHDWAEAKQLRKDFPNAGTMFMTTSELQLTYALNADWVDMIIPFHASGLPTEVINMRMWEDATAAQNETLYSQSRKRDMLREISDKVEEKYGKKVGSLSAEEVDDAMQTLLGVRPTMYTPKGKPINVHFYPFDSPVETDHGIVIIPGHHNDKERYLALCKEYGVVPRFEATTYIDENGNHVSCVEHPQYMKLIKETARTDSEQTAIKFNLDEPNPVLGNNITTGKPYTPMEFAMQKLREFAQQGGYSNVSDDSNFGIIPRFMEGVIGYEQRTGKERPLDYISPDARNMWFYIKKGAEAAEMTEEELLGDIPYHPADQEAIDALKNKDVKLSTKQTPDSEEADYNVYGTEVNKESAHTIVDLTNITGRILQQSPLPDIDDLTDYAKANLAIYEDNEINAFRHELIRTFPTGRAYMAAYDDVNKSGKANPYRAEQVGKRMIGYLRTLADIYNTRRKAWAKQYGKDNDGLRAFDNNLRDINEAITWYSEFAQGQHQTLSDSDVQFSTKPSLATAGTLFSGGGVMEQGLRGIIEPKFACEWIPKIRGVYENNATGKHAMFPNVNEITPQEYWDAIGHGNLEYLHASPVCHNFSGAKAKRIETDEDREYAKSIVRGLNCCNPSVFTLENTAEYVGSDSWKMITDCLTRNGYDWDYHIINAADYGAPTSRKRLLIRAVAKGMELPPLPPYKERGDWYEAISDILVDGNDVSFTEISPEMTADFFKDLKGKPNKDRLYLVLDKQYGKWRIVENGRPAPTILANKAYDEYILSYGESLNDGQGGWMTTKVTPRMLARLQGLPDDYKLPKSKALAHTIIGNGIPCDLVREVIGSLLEGRTSLVKERKLATARMEEKYEELAEHYLPEFDRGTKKEEKLRKIFNRYVLDQANAGIVPFLTPHMNYREKGVSQMAHALKGERMGRDIVENEPLPQQEIEDDFMKPYVPGEKRPKMRKDTEKVAFEISADARKRAIKQAAHEMATFVPPHSVLIPMPSHTGRATHTIMLANEIAKITGSPVVDALEGLARESNYDKKQRTGKSLTPEEMGMHLREGIVIPEGYTPIIVDNVINKGATGAASVRALGGGIVLAYAYAGNMENDNIPLKSAELVTYDEHGKVIPLDERFDKDKKDIRFSTKVEQHDPFYSNAAKAVASIQQKKATGDQWLAMIRKNGGLKAEEDKWMGLSDFLAGKKSVTKDELEQFIADNAIKVQDVHYDENGATSPASELRDMGFFEFVHDEWHNNYDNSIVIKKEGNAFNVLVAGAIWETRKSLSEAKVAAQECANEMWGDVYESEGNDKNVRNIHSVRLHYTTNGLTNKHEIAMVVPNVEPYDGDLPEIHFNDDLTQGRAVAWGRFGDADDTEGNKVLVIDEVQSQRHQDAREKGYVESASKTIDELKNKEKNAFDAFWGYNDRLAEKYGEDFYEYEAREDLESFLTPEEYQKYMELRNTLYDAEDTRKKAEGAVPDAPFRKNWHELAMKRILRYAAEHGYDKVAWTTGTQQARRYDLGNTISGIERLDDDRVVDTEKGERVIHLHTKESGDIAIGVDSNGKVTFSSTDADVFTGKSLSAVIGKEYAEKAMALNDNESFELDKEQMLGGEGMKGFYDKMLPLFMDKYCKRWGTKTHDIELFLPNEEDQVMHAVDVTDEMKSSVMQGQPMFSMKGIKGATEEEATKLESAEQMLTEMGGDYKNLSREDKLRIKMTTGWEQGADGKWRYEVPGLKWKADAFTKRWGKNVKLSDLLEENDLFKAYPELDNIRIVRTKDMGIGGSYSAERNEIKINTEYLKTLKKNIEYFKKSYDEAVAGQIYDYVRRDLGAKNNRLATDEEVIDYYKKVVEDYEKDLNTVYEELQDTLNHEVQHIIQHIEGFAIGGSNKIDIDMINEADPIVRDFTHLVGGNSASRLLNAGYPSVMSAIRKVKFDSKASPAMRERADDILSSLLPSQFAKVVEESTRLYDKARESAKEKYPRYAGEVEARNAGTRSFMTDEERRNSLLEDTEDKPRNEQIFRYSTKVYTANMTAKSLNIPITNIYDKADIPADLSKDVKGWYDPKTGKISIVPDNCYDDNDVKATVLHEAVAHLGLRNLMGQENLNNFLTDLYMDGTPELRDAIVKYLPKNNWDYRRAAEEYCASFAEKDDIDVPLWNQVKMFFLDALRKMGINVRLSDEDVQYMLWKSKNALRNGDFFDRAKDISRQMDLGVGNYARYSMKKPGAYDSNYAKNLYERSASSILTAGREAWQDSMITLRQMQDAIATETGSPIADWDNAYLAENRMHGTCKNEAEWFDDNLYRPMLEMVANLMKRHPGKVSDTDITDYLIAKHGLERNLFFAFKNSLDEFEQIQVGIVKAQKVAGGMDEAQASREAVKEAHKLRNDIYKSYTNDADLIQVKDDYQHGVIPTYREYLEKVRDIMERYAGTTLNVKDASGLTELTGDAKHYEDQAYDIVEAMELPEVYDDVWLLWDRINDATKWTLKKTRDTGRMTQESYEYTSGMFDFYVPLRGWDDTTVDEVWNYRTTSAGAFSPTLKKMKGRKSQADSPLAYIGNMAVSEITIGNNNLMKQHFLRMVQHHPTSLATVSETWWQNIGTDADPNWVERTPNYTDNMTALEIAQETERFNQEMEQLKANGEATNKRGSFKVEYKNADKFKQEHTVKVMVDGKEYSIFVNANPKVVQAINGTNIVKGLFSQGELDKKVQKALSKFNRFIAEKLTSQNPSFVFANLTRDMLAAQTQILVKESKGYIKLFEGNVFQVLRPRMDNGRPTGAMPMLLRKWKKGTLNTSTPLTMESCFDEFMRYGGETGFVALLAVDDFKEDIKKELDKFTGHTTMAGDAWRAFVDTIEFYNRAVEDATRFTTYWTSRQSGKSIEQSIFDAKNISLNFDKSGSGDMGNRLARDLYLFINPAIQALQNLGHIIKTHPFRLTALMAMYVGRGMMQGWLNNLLLGMIGDDEDQDTYYALPERVRRDNLVIWIPGTHNFLKIPLSQEYRVWHALGETIATVMTGNSDENPALSLVSSLVGLMPIDPLDNEGNLMMTLSPQFMKPFVDIHENQTYSGYPVYKDGQSYKYEPEFQTASYGTPTFFIKLSEGLNTLGGGNAHRKGAIEKATRQFGGVGEMSTNPSVWNHLLNGYYGGIYQTISQAFNTVWDAAVYAGGGEAPKLGGVPIVSRFMARPLEKDDTGKLTQGDRSKFDEAAETQSEFSHWKKDAKGEKEGADEALDRIANDPMYEQAVGINKYKTIIDRLRQQYQITDDEDEKKEILGELQEILEEFRAEYEE